MTRPEGRPPAIAAFVARLGRDDTLAFAETLALIGAHYRHTPTAFDNGAGGQMIRNSATQNQGSCRVLAFARLQGLDESQTLACFGEHYRHVLATPGGTAHAHIRAFMQYGWPGVRIHGEPLASLDGATPVQ